MTTVPTDAEPQEVRAVTTNKKSTMSVAAANRAAREAGFDVIDATALQAAGKVGEFVEQVGAIHLGRARLAVNLKRADSAMDFCTRLAEAADDPELSMGLMKVAADFLGKSNDAATMLIKSVQTAAESAKAESQTLAPGFGPRTPAGPPPQTPVLIRADNVTVSGGETKQP